MTPDLDLWIFIWLATVSVVVLRNWGTGKGVGLLLGYVVSYGAIHWLAALLYLLPWSTQRSPEFVLLGLRQSAFGLMALGVGVEIGALVTHRGGRLGASGDAGDDSATLPPSAATVLLTIGAVLYGFLFPVARGLPTVTALLAVGSSVMVVGVCLKFWTARQAGRPRRAFMWLAACVAAPFLTVTTQGFLGYGMAAMLIVYTFAAATTRTRWRVAVAGTLVAYVGLSVYVTYMRDRQNIRDVVWEGGTLSDRAREVSDTILQIEWFDARNTEHLQRIDTRLNQNYLVGLAVARVESGRVPLARGETIVDALSAMVPRALWPDKPMSAGSGDLVSIYTGLRFARDTSVGIGQVMEFYVNFGSTGVVLGFLLIGVVLGVADRVAYRALEDGQVASFVTWYIPALALLQVGGSLVEVTSSAGAGLAVALSIGMILRRLPPEVIHEIDAPDPMATAESGVQS